MNKVLRVGVVGYGSRLHHVLRYMCKLHHEVQVVAIVDPRAEDIRSQNEKLTETRLTENFGSEYKNIQYYGTIADMVESVELDGLMIGTRCNTHTELAIEAMKTQLPIFLEKPVSTTMAQIEQLYRSSRDYKNEMVVSFPLKMSIFAQKTRQLIEDGVIGKVRHVEAVNHVCYGTTYFHNHYRDFEETGGLWLQKATHDLDVVSFLLNSRPKRVAAMHSVNKVFGGDVKAGMTCGECEKFETCPESPFFDYYHRSGDDVMGNKDKLCAFGEDVGTLEDHGLTLIEYENGAQVSYNQNFYIRNKPKRGVSLIGYEGNIEFDYYTAEIVITPHHSRERQVIKVEHTDDHGGGDPILVNNFVHLMRGTQSSKSPLMAGIESAYLCLLCRESAETGAFASVPELDKFFA
jgi:predicted dehydrogenase